MMARLQDRTSLGRAVLRTALPFYIYLSERLPPLHMEKYPLLSLVEEEPSSKYRCSALAE